MCEKDRKLVNIRSIVEKGLKNLGTRLVFSVHASHVENVVASDKNLSEISLTVSVNVLLGVSQLQIHVGVDSNKDTFVLHSPLQFANDKLSGETVEERFWVHWLNCGHF